MNYLIVSNGDTDEYVRFEWKLFNGGDKIKALLDLLIDKSSRNWDTRRKCWFIHASVAENFINAMKALFAQPEMRHWLIKDKRTKWETFEEFFETPPPMGKAPKTKAELIRNMEHLLKTNNVMVSLREDCDLLGLKKYYRQAALALHPDRNNDDGTKMAELNIIWDELKEKF